MIISTIHIKISSCVINRHTHRHIHHLNACRHASFLDTRNLCLYKFNILLLSLPVMEIRHPNRSNLEEKSFFGLPVLVYGPLLLGSHSSTHLKELFTLHPLPRAESNGSIMHTDQCLAQSLLSFSPRFSSRSGVVQIHIFSCHIN